MIAATSDGLFRCDRSVEPRAVQIDAVFLDFILILRSCLRDQLHDLISTSTAFIPFIPSFFQLSSLFTQFKSSIHQHVHPSSCLRRQRLPRLQNMQIRRRPWLGRHLPQVPSPSPPSPIDMNL